MVSSKSFDYVDFMTAVFITLGIIVGIIVLVALMLIGMYNGLVKLRNRYRNSFAQIEVQLKRRYDLIPNLIETAKAFMSHERETLEAVISARNTAENARQGAVASQGEGAAVGTLVAAEAGLGKAMGGFWGLSEAYPDLKSNANMMQLSEELTATENKVAFSRQAYNDSVTSYNTKLETFPTNVLAGFFSFKPATLFEVSDPEEREAVKVNF